MTKIAFYAPIKPPDHHIPSGDRLIAGNSVKALEMAGFEVELASRFIAYSKRDARDILDARKLAAGEEIAEILTRFGSEAPDLWLTYHPYCKAPDWIGPAVSRALGIPYVTLEAARTGQGFEDGGDRWKPWRLEAQAGMKAADLHLVFKDSDRSYLKELLGGEEKLRNIAPFIDTDVEEPRPIQWPSAWRPGAPTLIAVGMMRPGKKTENFHLLSQALEPLQSLHWNLVVIGDGPEMDRVRGFFDLIQSQRILFTGALPHERVLDHMASSDLFVWPGWREPIGMVYLEAQLMGLGVAAFNSLGVPLVVSHGETGLLALEGDVDALSDNLATLISHPSLRHDLGVEAKKQVHAKHSLQAAALAFKENLMPLLSSR